MALPVTPRPASNSTPPSESRSTLYDATHTITFRASSFRPTSTFSPLRSPAASLATWSRTTLDSSLKETCLLILSSTDNAYSRSLDSE